MPSQAFWGRVRSWGIVATPGYSIFLTPWAGSFDNSGWATRNQNSGFLGGGYLAVNNGNQNNYVAWNEWFDAGTYKFSLIYSKGGTYGIHNLQADGVLLGTIDAYAAGATDNNYSEVTGIAMTAGLKVLRDITATKNGSASSYEGIINSLAAIRTGA